MKKISKLDSNTKEYLILYAFGLLLLLSSFFVNSPKEIFDGMNTIFFSPSNLTTDYIEIGNLGAALFNSGMMTLLSIFLARRVGAMINGPLIAGIFIVSGFSFFGKNILNSIPITIGVYLYARSIKLPFKNYILPALFGSCLGPLVSEIAFGMNLDLFKGILIGYLAGIFVGYIIPPLSQSFLRFHRGFSLYNVGFTAGIIGMFITATFKMFNVNIETVSYISSGHDLELSIILYIIFVAMVFIGIVKSGNIIKEYKELLKNTGQLVADFFDLYGYGITLFNMGVMGIIFTTYILLIGGELSGPVVGGILTVVGFSSFGKHPKNTIPILIGARLAVLLNIYDENSASSLMIMLFGTNLAPICGKYGFIAGAVAGFVHVAVVSNLAYLHGGLNLYNNGFAGGFVAATLVPLYDSIILAYKRRKYDTRR
ncbi:DUF1576 domain-containing protein [Mediannikoviicoccus vaginalis]|uniref:DUF1576 domain-containing protein n=1 Tax=Mediannikoviicoccus vaginalis TaxID=2899727 RepID=UPI001F15730B|nr:DUF1576 domain-containing protein [Mediannikoviicoccus vaginalis]